MQNNESSQQLNRRQFLVGAGATAATLALSACAAPSTPDESSLAWGNEGQSNYVPILHPEALNNNTQATYLGYKSSAARAAYEQMGGWEGRFHVSQSTIINGGSVAFVNGGWGALIHEKTSGQDIYAVATVPHVVLNAGYLEQFTMHIPNVGFVEVQNPKWMYTKPDNQITSLDTVDNSHWYFALSGPALDYVKGGISRNLVTPVKPVHGIPEYNEPLAVLVDEDLAFRVEDGRDTIKYVKHFGGLDIAFGLVKAEFEGGYKGACNHSSGESVFRVTERGGREYLTGEVWGSLRGTYHHFLEPDSPCGDTIGYKPFYPLGDLS